MSTASDIRTARAAKRADYGTGDEWRDIFGFEGRYQVSSCGLVRSLPRPVRCTSHRGEEIRIARGRVLSPAASRTGHLSVCLGRSNRRAVHRLVHEAFLGPIPDGFDVAHLDGNPANNTVTNLAAVTRRENNRHVAYHGRRPLSVEQVRRIRAAVVPDCSPEIRRALADEMGTNRRHINRVARGESYAYIE